MKKSRYKPFYKQFLKLKANVQNRPKIFKFQKQKWNFFQKSAARKLKFFKRFKLKDQFKIYVPRFKSRGNSLQKKFKTNLKEQKLFSLFYGRLKKKYIKNQIKRSHLIKSSSSNLLDSRNNVLKNFESRLDTVIYRSNFSLSMKGASQLILHGHILVNDIPVRAKSCLLKPNDIVGIKSSIKSRSIIKKNLDRSNFWPIPPKFLVINYNTLQILFLNFKVDNTIFNFNHYLSINSVISNLKLIFNSSEVEQVAVNHLDVGSNPA